MPLGYCEKYPVYLFIKHLFFFKFCILYWNIADWPSLIAQLVKNLPAMQETRFNSWVRKILWRRDRLPTPIFLGFPCGSAGKESACNAGDLGSFPWLGRSPGEGKDYPFQYSGLENSIDSPWGCRVRHDRVTFTFTKVARIDFLKL